MKSGLVIGIARLYDLPGKEFNIIHCNACGNLFHTAISEGNIVCQCCHELIQLNKIGENK